MAGMKETYRAIFGEDLQKESYKLINHSFEFNKRAGKSICTNCGLLALRNEFTDWSIRVGCMASDHPQYENVRRRTSTMRFGQ
ncbi:MAG: hypothetical protein V4440_03085 [Pseudomonadota bacterium]